MEVYQSGAAGTQGVDNRSVSPDLPIRADGKYPMAKGAPMPKIKTKGPDPVFTEEEFRHFSSNIAKDCDNAFKSSLIEEDSIAGSLGESDRKRRDSPFTFSLESTPNMTPATEMSMNTWDSRPLPPLPSNRTLHSQTMTSPRMNSPSVMSFTDSEDNEKATEGVARIAVPVRLGPPSDRRVVSAPAQTHSSKKLTTMPSINENAAVNVVSQDKSRIVSAPPHTPRKRFNGQAQGMEYLSRVENSIRVVHSPTTISPVKIPAPLRVQKKGTVKGEARRQISQQYPHSDGGSSENQGGGIVMKKKPWFKRASRAESDGVISGLRDSQDQLTSDNTDDPSAGVAGKKKSFSFPFWKGSKSSELRMSIAAGKPISCSSHVHRYQP